MRTSKPWFIAALSSVAFASHALSAAAFWDTHPQLLCRGETVGNCSADLKTCSTMPSTAVWLIDFEKGLVTYRTNELAERIVSRNQEIFEGHLFSEAVTLSSNRLLRFYPAANPNDPIRALMVGTSSGLKADVTTFTCSAP